MQTLGSFPSPMHPYIGSSVMRMSWHCLLYGNRLPGILDCLLCEVYFHVCEFRFSIHVYAFTRCVTPQSKIRMEYRGLFSLLRASAGIGIGDAMQQVMSRRFDDEGTPQFHRALKLVPVGLPPIRTQSEDVEARGRACAFQKPSKRQVKHSRAGTSSSSTARPTFLRV